MINVSNENNNPQDNIDNGINGESKMLRVNQ